MGIPDNESVEDYEKAMDLITEQCIRDWDEEDEKAVIQYKEDVRSGKIKPIKYEGNLRELIDKDEV